jgi:hypothetical protein
MSTFFIVDAPIIDIIITELYFHPDKYDGFSQIKALKIFTVNVRIQHPLFRRRTQYYLVSFSLYS